MVTARDYYSLTLMYEIKAEDVYEDFSKGKEMFDFISYSANSSYYNGPNKLVVGKMKDETASVAVKEVIGLKPKMYFFLIDDSSKHKKSKYRNKNVVANIFLSMIKYIS